MTPPEVSLSMVVPAFNEAARIAAPLREMAAWLAKRPERCELIVVDDGSRDDTAALVVGVAADLPVDVRVLSYSPNRGKGYALKVGFAAARGERILFSDCDLSTPLEEGERLLRALDEHEIAIGSRKAPGSQIEVHQAAYREWMGKVFTALVRRAIADVTDATCGFKAFRGDVGRDLFSRLRVYDWSFDAELLLIARRRELSLVELPVRWSDQAGTKVNVMRDALRALEGLLRIRWNDWLGRYDLPHPLDGEIRLLHPSDSPTLANEGDDSSARSQIREPSLAR